MALCLSLCDRSRRVAAPARLLAARETRRRLRTASKSRSRRRNKPSPDSGPRSSWHRKEQDQRKPPPIAGGYTGCRVVLNAAFLPALTRRLPCCGRPVGLGPTCPGTVQAQNVAVVSRDDHHCRDETRRLRELLIVAGVARD